ncbi:hypothetical protein [Deinococcus sp. Leaf326]|uniref:hypothetical protein n=1 Tax=Deinococcus sp. Leaf326 TaxID=1736338 RepID=UPI0012E0E817|nr:hypothetical protein [Deinococcus sp. Leaf326]
MATTLTGIDPLWGWKEFLLHRNPNTHLDHALTQFVAALDFLPRTRALGLDTPDHQMALFLVREFAGHLRACLRALNLRLPLHQEFEDSLRSLGPLRASPQTPQENENAVYLWFQIRDRLQQHASTEEQPTPAEHEEAAPAPTSVTPPAPEPTPETSPALPSPKPQPAAPLHLQHVQEARALLEGRALTLIGGVPYPAHHQALVDALGLARLDWIGSAEYDHGTHAHSRVTDQTAVVILAIRWMGHAHNGLRDVARAKGVPYVMHPGGLNPSSVAWQIL